jgi:hypothetical protein
MGFALLEKFGCTIEVTEPPTVKNIGGIWFGDVYR